MGDQGAWHIEVPVLYTERLRLRGHTREDLPAMHTMWSDPEVTRYLGVPPHSLQDTWARFFRYLGHWAAIGFGYWVLEDKQTGTFVGEAGFADYHRKLDPDIPLAPEIGWVLAAPMHGKGYASEAAQALLQWGDTVFDPATAVRCLIEEGHTASRHVAEKCGFAACTTVLYAGRRSWVLERPALEERTRAGLLA